MKHIAASMLLMMLAYSILPAQTRNLDSLWHPLGFLIGEWVGEGGGNPGMGIGVASFAFDLNKNVIVRKNHTEFPAVNGRPAAVHEDLMTLYRDPAKDIRAIYFDNEGHVIHYAVVTAVDTVILLSDVQAGAPRFRLTYVRVNDTTVTIAFDMALPNATDRFMHYITGRTHKK